MKYLFLAILLAMIALSVGTWKALPEASSPRPILYWVTDANPAREDQIHLFHLWQIKHGHSVSHTLKSADDAKAFVEPQGRLFKRSLMEINPVLQNPDTATYPLTIQLPLAEMRVDTANADATKRIIQGVSGVGGDVMDLWSGATMWQFVGMNLLRDVTEDASRLGFGPDQTYAAILPEIAIPTEDGRWRQYQFPCNVVAPAYFTNLEQFKKVGMPPPPTTWTVDAFEAYGREYVKRANVGLERPRFFLVNAVDASILRRSFGASELNETMTACTIDDPRNVAAMEKYMQWQNEYRILPNAVDRAGFATDSGYGGADAQLFNAGNYAMLFTGRYLLISFRKFNIDRVNAGLPPMELGFSEIPYQRFANTTISTRAAAVYIGGKHQDLAVLFQAYLASEDYNMQIVRDADSLPPNPIYTQRPEYIRPDPDPARGIYPQTEYAVHVPFTKVAEQRGVANSHSPFVLNTVVTREINRADDVIRNQVQTPAVAYADAKRRIDLEIDRNLKENPRLTPLYETKVKQQAKIEQMKRAIEAHLQTHPNQPVPDAMKIPMKMIDNPFHRAYYAHEGWAK